MDWRAKVELYEQIRREYEFGVGSVIGVARKLGVHRRMVREAVRNAVPAQRKKTDRPALKMAAASALVDAILELDRKAPRKQRHTARRIYDRIRAEIPGCTAAERTVRQYVERRRQALGLAEHELFVPQSYDWGVDAQVDWYEAYADLDGERIKLQVFEMRSMASGAAFHRAYPCATQQAFLEAHELAFEYFEGVFRRLRYDNLSSAVKKILRGQQRELTARFIAFRSHWQYQAEFCTPGEGHEKGGVEGEVGYFRRNHWVPVPVAADLQALNRKLLEDCRADEGRIMSGHTECVGARLLTEKEHLLPLAAEPFDLAEVSFPRVDQTGCAKVRTNSYSVPLKPGSIVEARVYSCTVEFRHHGSRIASHERCYSRLQKIFDLEHSTLDSLRSYTIPDWFADAKFGIWSHWGPQSAVGDGDWYARNMYVEGTPQYEYHVQRFGPQSKVGYKDLIHLFTAERWDPEHLMDLYAKAGAKYFFSMGVHHDGFDLWNSKHQPRWNSVATGPKRNVVGEWGAAARKRGLRFGVSEHLSNSYEWLAPAHLADTKGPYTGVPYDGQNAAYADLYHDYSKEPKDYAQSISQDAMGRDRAPEWWKKHYLDRVKDLVDQHQPDLLYTDGGIVFGTYGPATVAELYNVGPKTYDEKPATVYFSKTKTDCVDGRSCVVDHERSVLGEIDPVPWQTDTCIGEWHYKVGVKYKPAKKVIDMLVDIVSKNGNLLLNFPLPASGELDADEVKVLQGITEWISVNGEGIYATRPWKIYGEGPSTEVVIKPTGKEFDPNEGKKPDLGATDIRFTRKGETVYAFVMGWPQSDLLIESLAMGSAQRPSKAVDVRILGHEQPLRFAHDGRGLRVSMPSQPTATSAIGVALRIRFV